MNKAATLSPREAVHKAEAEHHLAEARRILRELAAEREREASRRVRRTSLAEEVKAILQGA